jgi:RNA polymerase sigma-70 factor, ECF subfamily
MRIARETRRTPPISLGREIQGPGHTAPVGAKGTSSTAEGSNKLGKLVGEKAVADFTITLDLDSSAGLSAPDVPREDERLLEGLRTGAPEAYEQLIDAYQQPVYNLVYHLMDDPSETADVVQEVFLKIFRNVGSFRGNSSLKTWIYRISFNEAHNHRRWFSRHKKQEVGLEKDDEESLSLQEVLQDPGRSAFDLMCDVETQSLVEEALTTLNPAFRAAVVLRDIEDLSYEEIAEVLQVSLGTVKSRILRGREALKKSLASRLRPEPALQFTPAPAR